MIRVENVSYKYKNSEKKVIDNLNFTINDGEVVVIVGKNGSGKSTIAKLLMGIKKLKKGNIFIDGEEIRDKKNFDDMGIVLGNPENQIIFNSFYDEISFSLNNVTDEEIDKSLELVDMKEYKNREMYNLSMGQKQRMVIAEVLIKKPKYVIFDEPTTMIDSLGKEKIYNIIKDLKRMGYTIILITNLADELLLGDRILILSEGYVKEEILKKDIINKTSVLESYGIRLPTIIDIICKLRKCGINLEIDDYTVEELVGKIKELC